MKRIFLGITGLLLILTLAGCFSIRSINRNNLPQTFEILDGKYEISTPERWEENPDAVGTSDLFAGVAGEVYLNVYHYDDKSYDTVISEIRQMYTYYIVEEEETEINGNPAWMIEYLNMRAQSIKGDVEYYSGYEVVIDMPDEVIEIDIYYTSLSNEAMSENEKDDLLEIIYSFN
jgi:hypothetical protein